jgi:hypothetical protein
MDFNIDEPGGDGAQNNDNDFDFDEELQSLQAELPGEQHEGKENHSSDANGELEALEQELEQMARSDDHAKQNLGIDDKQSSATNSDDDFEEPPEVEHPAPLPVPAKSDIEVVSEAEAATPSVPIDPIEFLRQFDEALRADLAACHVDEATVRTGPHYQEVTSVRRNSSSFKAYYLR